MLDETEASRGKLAVSREEFFADYDTPNKISIAVANECFDILVDLKPLTIINESGRGFIISDNPVTLYNLLYARRNYRINYGLGTGGIIIFLPLSPTVCFCLCDPEVYDEKSEDGFNITIKFKNQVNELNKMFAQNAYTPLLLSYFSLPYPQNILLPKNADSHICISGWHAGQISSGCFFLLSTP